MLTNSVTMRPADPGLHSRMSRRNAEFVTPDIGARRRFGVKV
jgi:hypothetical protein